MAREQMLAARDLDVLWVVGANPLKDATLASKHAFVVVQDLFLTETAKRADIVLPAASAYEKNGTVTNVCGEVQRLKARHQGDGREDRSRNYRPDRQGNGRAAKLGIWLPDKVFDEIRKTVHGYDVPLPVVATGGAAPTMPLERTRGARCRRGCTPPATRLFTSGTLGALF